MHALYACATCGQRGAPPEARGGDERRPAVVARAGAGGGAAAGARAAAPAAAAGGAEATAEAEGDGDEDGRDEVDDLDGEDAAGLLDEAVAVRIRRHICTHTHSSGTQGIPKQREKETNDEDLGHDMADNKRNKQALLQQHRWEINWCSCFGGGMRPRMSALDYNSSLYI